MTAIGKNRGLARLANDNGHFTMVALDQRPPLFAAIAEAKGVTPDQVSFADMVAAKRLLVQALARHASSMLLDPNFAIPAAIDLLPPTTGLIVTLEDHRVEETPGGRKSRAISNWNVDKIRQLGADAVKVLIWYRPDADRDVNDHQKAFARSIGEDCRRHDIPYILELLVYPFLKSANYSGAYAETQDKRAELVIESVREFARPEYGVDLLKLESPVPTDTLPKPGSGGEAREAQAQFDAIGAICRDASIPWVLLSGGAAPEMFERVLTYAYASGAHGFLAGRTIWLDAIRSHFPNEAAVLAALEQDGVQRFGRLDSLTAKEAKVWKPSFQPMATAREGDFAASYGFAV